MIKGINLKKVRRTAFSVFSIYLIWFAGVGSILAASMLFSSSSYTALILSDVFSVLFFLVIAVLITEIFLVYTEDILAEIPFIRFSLFILTGAVAVVLYILSSSYGFKGQFHAALGTANLLVFACLCASWMAEALKKPSDLVPVCAVVALADLFSVFAGPSRDFARNIAVYYEKGMEGPPPVVDFILIKIPVPGIDVPVPLFGVSDWIVLAFLCTAALKFGLSDSIVGAGIGRIKNKKQLFFYFPTVLIGLAMAVLIARISGVFLPALPFVVFMFLFQSFLANRELFRLDKRQFNLLVWFSVALIGFLFFGLYFKP